MNKSPLKFDYNIFWMCMGGGVIIAIFVHLISGEPLTWTRLSLLFGILGCFFVIGCIVTAQTATLFRRTVTNSVQPEDLISGNTYWLNGNSEAVYVGPDLYRGTFGFHFVGYHSDKDETECKFLIPGYVRLYISDRKEVDRIDD